MNATDAKRRAALAALQSVEPDSVLGIGTGSTVDIFIDELAAGSVRIRGAVSSSERTSERLRRHDIEVLDLNSAGALDLYIDGADESDHQRRLIKGGGAALTREKIIAAASRRFICIADETKLVNLLGAFPLPVEVIPMARSYVARELLALLGENAVQPVYRQGVITDNGNQILDLHGLQITDPVELETQINQITGVVTVGLFARRPADVVILGTASGVTTL